MSEVVMERTWPEERPELLPFLPLVLSVWMDGVLSAAELAALHAHVDAEGLLSDGGRDVLATWLDPDSAPTASELQALGSRIRRFGVQGDADATRSLTDLGLALWRAAGAEECCWSEPDATASLRALERSLGVLGAEAARRMVGGVAVEAADRQGPGWDSGALRAFLDRDHLGLRDQVLELLTRPELEIPIGLPYAEHRERVLAAVRFLAERGLGRLAFPEEHGGSGDRAAAVAVFETLAYGDLSVLVKFGVQFGLFGGSVQQLGTARHHAAYLERIGTLDLPGCYAMTEVDHGSNVRELETTATYDGETDELVVNTPHPGAAKDYIGNAARDGRLATVFARLMVGPQDHGVHAVLVPIRDEGGHVLPRVKIEDRGLKMGLNGVDNGRISFANVRVPRDNLLDRFGTIDSAGRYHSPIASSGRRFFGMLRTLVAGRISIAAAAVGATKVGLTIAVRYASARVQFGAKGEPERPILDYPLVQRALMPHLATTLGLHFAVRRLQVAYGAATPDDEAELEVNAAGLKAYASDHCTATLQACREACGGQGYMAENGISVLMADTNVFTTFEGANGVLYQLVAKGLLSRFRDQMGDLNLWRALRYLGERAESSLTALNPVATRRTDRDHLLDEAFHAAALQYREERLLRSAASRIRSRLEDGMDSFHAVTEVQDHLVTLAQAYVERTILAGLHDAVEAAPSPGLSEALRSVSALYALSRIDADRGWFLDVGYLEGPKSRAIRALGAEMCTEVAELSPTLVDAFAIPERRLPVLVRSGLYRP